MGNTCRCFSTGSGYTVNTDDEIRKLREKNASTERKGQFVNHNGMYKNNAKPFIEFVSMDARY